jgi:hypothetical protein
MFADAASPAGEKSALRRALARLLMRVAYRHIES